MTSPIERARQLFTKYKLAHLPAEMAIVHFAFEFPDDGMYDAEQAAVALGVDITAFDYVFKQLKEERLRQNTLLSEAKPKSEKKLDDMAKGAHEAEEQLYENMKRTSRASNPFNTFGRTNAPPPPPPTKPPPKATTFGANKHRGKPWENAPAHLIDHCAVLELAWPTDADALKKAFRAMALANHPDRNPGDAAKEAIFKAASEAHERINTYLENLKP